MTPTPSGSGKYPGYWAIKKVRRGLRNFVSRRLARQSGPRPLVPIEPTTVHRLIVCRRNNRLGNMLFLTPLLRSLAATVPQAEIDLLIGSAGYADLFRGLPGIRQVWTMPRRGWLWPWRMLSLLYRLRRQHYDLAVEPSQNSFSNRLSARLCGARWRLGFYARDQWLSLTHSVSPKMDERHEALKPLALVRRGFSGSVTVFPRLDIALTGAEQAVGRARLAAALGKSGPEPTIGFFTEATGKKRLPPEWWQAWVAGLRQSGQGFRLLQILPPGTAEAVERGLPHVREPDHRRLAAILGHLDLFVSCDAGPMHLASAAGAPTIGFFHATKSSRYRPLSENSLALDVKDLTPPQAADAVLAHLHKIPRLAGTFAAANPSA